MADKRGRPPRSNTVGARRSEIESAWAHEWHLAIQGAHGATAAAIKITGRSRSQVKRDVAVHGAAARRVACAFVPVVERFTGVASAVAADSIILDQLAPMAAAYERKWAPGFDSLEELPWAAIVVGWRAMERRAARRKYAMAWIVRDRVARAELLRLIERAAA